ncbi:MAG: HTH-type transcriptional repressor FabR [Pseudomonadales bacterium]
MKKLDRQVPQVQEKSARKAPITERELMDAAISLLDSHRSVSSLSLREIAKAAGIAPNSFYRHFRDVNELAVALIDQAGRGLRGIIREARRRLNDGSGGIRASVEVFMEQLDSEQKYLHILLREMSIGSEAFRQAVDRELRYFEDELRDELEKIATAQNGRIYQPQLVAKAITRLVFAQGASAADLSPAERHAVIEETTIMVRMIIHGARGLAEAK